MGLSPRLKLQELWNHGVLLSSASPASVGPADSPGLLEGFEGGTKPCVVNSQQGAQLVARDRRLTSPKRLQHTLFDARLAIALGLDLQQREVRRVAAEL